jgi:16S rRNA (cytosine1402-N4)-methyltransferase
VRDCGLAAVDGVVFDVGVSSMQLDEAERGFSFRRDGPLDMRMERHGPSAADLVNEAGEAELADIFFHYGEERFSRRVARRIVETRKRQPFETTQPLAELVRRCVPRSKGQRIDPATRVFQALRIAVNDELGTLERLIQSLPACLKPGGRAVIISFHSLEDRQVKRAFADKARWQVLTKKPVTAGDAELQSNPRSRSAKLRAAQRPAA